MNIKTRFNVGDIIKTEDRGDLLVKSIETVTDEFVTNIYYIYDLPEGIEFEILEEHIKEIK